MPGEARSGRDPLLGAGPPRTSAPAPATLPAICTQQDLVSTAEGPVLIRGVSTSHVPGRGGPTRTKGGPRESVRGQHGLPLPRTEAGPTRRGRGHGTESACRTQSAPGRDPRQPSAPDSPCPHRAGRPSPGRGSRRRGGRVPSLPGRSPRDPGVRPGHALPEPPPHPRPDPGPRRHLAAPLRPSAVSRGPQGGGRGQAAAPALRSVREGAAGDFRSVLRGTASGASKMAARADPRASNHFRFRRGRPAAGGAVPSAERTYQRTHALWRRRSCVLRLRAQEASLRRLLPPGDGCSAPPPRDRRANGGGL